MDPIGPQQRQLELAEQFADAMKTADVKHIAETGRFTPRMQIAWNLFVEWCYEYEKERLQKNHGI